MRRETRSPEVGQGLAVGSGDLQRHVDGWPRPGDAARRGPRRALRNSAREAAGQELVIGGARVGTGI
eukprot:2028085-Alexandrium_andersonii.AAC.1